MPFCASAGCAGRSVQRICCGLRTASDRAVDNRRRSVDMQPRLSAKSGRHASAGARVCGGRRRSIARRVRTIWPSLRCVSAPMSEACASAAARHAIELYRLYLPTRCMQAFAICAAGLLPHYLKHQVHTTPQRATGHVPACLICTEMPMYVQQLKGDCAMQAATQEAPSEVLTTHKYCEDVYRSKRRPTRTVKVRTQATHHFSVPAAMPARSVTAMPARVLRAAPLFTPRARSTSWQHLARTHGSTSHAGGECACRQRSQDCAANDDDDEHAGRGSDGGTDQEVCRCWSGHGANNSARQERGRGVLQNSRTPEPGVRA